MPYTKTSSQRISYVNYLRQDQNDLIHPPYINESWSPASYVVSRSKTGEYLPKWKSIIREGGDATTAFSGYKQVVQADYGVVSCSYYIPWHPDPSKRGSGTDMREGYLYAPAVQTFSTGASLVAADNQALNRLYQDLKKIDTHFQGMIFVGELREALSMILSPARTLRRGLGEYLVTLGKRKRNAPKHRRRQIASETWLEYSFGWLPLLSDVKAGAEALARFEDDERRTTARGYGINESLQGGSTISSTLINYCWVITTSRDIAKAEVIYRVGVKYENTAPFGSARRLAELSGFTLQEFVPTVWELIPWSFVVDYFSNVGDILTCATTSTQGIFRKTKTTRTTYERVVRGRIDPAKASTVGGSAFNGIGGDPGGYKSSRTDVVRSKVTVLALPTFELRFPAFDSCKWINLAALTAGHRKLTPF